MRSIIRSAAEALLVESGATRLSAWGFRRRTLVLAYHNVVGAGDIAVGDKSLHLDFDQFRRQLDLLEKIGTVVPLESLETPSESGAKPRFVITFDDAYRGAIDLALPELRARGLPSTVFVPPGLLGCESFWWDAVPVSGWEHPELFGELRGEDAPIRAWAEARGLQLAEMPRLQGAASLEELAQAMTDDLVTLGCHTWDHPNLTELTSSEMQLQMSRTLEWLEESDLPWVRWISYPYGKTSEEVRRVADSLDFRGGLRIDGGWISSTPATNTRPGRLDLPRVNIPAGFSERGFRILITGMRSLLMRGGG